MKKLCRKLFSLIIVILLCLYTPNVCAADNSANINSDLDMVTEQPIEDTNIQLKNTVSTITSGAVYNIINAGSGKYLNVHYGIDSNNTNVYQYTCDYSTEQKFKTVYYSSTGSYKIHAMCSSNGNNRVLDIVRNGASLSDGQNVDIWTQVDDTAQYWKIISIGDGVYKICPTANTSLALTAYGTANGTSTGTSSTSAGNVYISTYTGSANQMWTFQEISTGAATPQGYFDSVSTSYISGWAWRSDIPNTAIVVHIYIYNSNGEIVKLFAPTADLYRSDLVAAGKGNGYHGFSQYIDWSDYLPDTYTIKIYAIGHNENNPELNSSPKTYTVTSTLGYKGYAVYRDLGKGAEAFSDMFLNHPNDWHAGLMDEKYASDYLSVIEMPGIFDDIQWSNWSDFVGELTYRGTYKPKQAISDNSRNLIISLARELRTKDIGYLFTHQLRATIRPEATKIEPDDVVDIRCDGLVEYCYEYFGFRVFGNDTYWDISKASAQNIAHHHENNIMPKAQAQQYLDLETTSVPNQ